MTRWSSLPTTTIAPSSAIEKMLAKDGHRCLRARNGQEALRLFWDERPDLIILDVMMPLLDGFQVCERIREHDRATPVLFLTAKGDIVDKRIGYGIGGDDYLVKPFSGEELRLPGGGSLASRANCGRSRSVRAPKRAIPRRRPGSERAHGECAPGGKTSRAYSQGVEDHGGAGIASGEVYSKRDLIEEIWGEEYLDSSIAISVYIRRIRAKLEPDPSEPRYVQTVWHCGYRLADEEDEKRDSSGE